MVDNIIIKCIQCGHDFIFTASEQRMYKIRNFSNPRRCPECRRKKAKLEDPPLHNTKNRNRKNEDLYR